MISAYSYLYIFIQLQCFGDKFSLLKKYLCDLFAVLMLKIIQLLNDVKASSRLY